MLTVFVRVERPAFHEGQYSARL